MKKFARRAGAVVLAGAVIGGGFVSAQAAQAAEIPGNITLHGPHHGYMAIGDVLTGGSATQNPMFNAIQIDAGCPAGTGGTQTWIFQGGEMKGAVSIARTAADQNVMGKVGVTPEHIDIGDHWLEDLNVMASNRALNDINNPVSDGPFEMRFYCHANNAQPLFDTESYFSLALNYNASAQTWALDVPAVPGENTSVSLTAAAQSDDTVVLNAEVKGEDSNVATGAAGNIEFLQDGVVIATVPVVNGVASHTTGALADAQYAFSARFVSDDSTVYENSTSAASTVIVGAWATEHTDVIVEIPSGVGSLTLTGVPSEVYLDGDQTTAGVQPAVLSGGTLNASGSLGNLTVTDTRQLDAPDWNLNGILGNFTSGANQIDAFRLGWEPSYVSGPGAAGAVVNPGVAAGEGLEVIRVLASGAVTDGQPETVVSADLNLAAPANTPAGIYSALLTITLV